MYVLRIIARTTLLRGVCRAVHTVDEMRISMLMGRKERKRTGRKLQWTFLRQGLGGRGGLAIDNSI